MRTIGVLLLAGLALSLTGCGSTMFADRLLGSVDPLVTSTVPRDSVPGFLAEPQDEDDVIDELDLAVLGIDPASVHYQGVWEGQEVFLAVSGGNAVKVITGIDGEPEGWGAGGSLGNSVIGLSETDEMTLQYLPQGTTAVPKGWSALSDWVIVRP